jgi:hypothetical protein
MTTPQDNNFNAEMARQFRAAANLLESQHADGFRVRAYRNAADELEHLDMPASKTYREHGVPGLVALPSIGHALAAAIADLVDFGRWRWLERLEGHVAPEQMLTTVAGIGSGLAASIHEQLGIETLEELEMAAVDGRLATVSGIGEKRVRSVKDSLAGRLRKQHSNPTPTTDLPTTEELLDVDHEYRGKVDQGTLATITPRRFNPDQARWLPVLHTSRGDHHYTVMFSNSARASTLGRSLDWVVIFAEPPNQGQWTVVTQHSGAHVGERTVRGRSIQH